MYSMVRALVTGIKMPMANTAAFLNAIFASLPGTGVVVGG